MREAGWVEQLHYLSGLLAPRDRNKTLTALAGAEPVVQAQSPEVQRLQYFLSEADWSAEALNARHLALLQNEAATVAHSGGVLVLDDTGDKKGGTAIEHVGRQCLGSLGKIDNGIVAVTTLWTDGRVHYPLHFAPYTPASRFRGGTNDPSLSHQAADRCRAHRAGARGRHPLPRRRC